MNIDKLTIDNISSTISEVVETAKNVNRLSYVRKQITSESLMLLKELMDKNFAIIINYKEVFNSLQNYISDITKNINTYRYNINLFKDIVSNVDIIKNKLVTITSKIEELTGFVNTIKKDTEEINVLATNAAIVSSKYNTSVFQILSAKFNSMSNYINQNLENIIKYVSPIKDSIDNLTNINSVVVSDIENGYHSYLLFLEKFGHQEKVVDKQVQRAEHSGEKIEDQKEMLANINKKILQMDADADKAIEGSGNNMKIGESLKSAVEVLYSEINNGMSNGKFRKTIDVLAEKGSTIKQTATHVNEKSKSQLDFSLSSLEFCKSIIEQSKELEKTISIFNKQSVENNKLALKIGTSINDLINQLNEIEKRIIESNETLKKFMEDYLNISDILYILKDILKLMKIIGIYSRIEASRDPVAYEGFLTISKHIQKLQNKIKNNIPKIESNIKDTKAIIDLVNESYQNISVEFNNIRENSIFFTNQLKGISQISTEAENISVNILNDSLNLDTLLSDLENYLNKLTEIVKEPIEGSAKNIQRGKFIEETTNEIKKILLQQTAFT
ncbi:MAG: methyl-accepting chemotaxis protein [Spirochaetota bacterium]